MRELIENLWDNMLTRVALGALAFGWVPAYLLSLVHSSLTSGS